MSFVRLNDVAFMMSPTACDLVNVSAVKGEVLDIADILELWEIL